MKRKIFLCLSLIMFSAAPLLNNLYAENINNDLKIEIRHCSS